jgi:hypothetical protein
MYWGESSIEPAGKNRPHLLTTGRARSKGRESPCYEPSQLEGLDVRVVPTDYVATSIIHGGPVPAWAAADKKSEQRKDRSHQANDHQNNAHGMYVESMLIWPGGNGEIKHRSDSESNDARYKSTSHRPASYSVSDCRPLPSAA